MESIEFLIVGSVFTAIGIFLFFFTSGLRNRGVKTMAQVHGHKTSYDAGDDDHTVNEVFEFQDTNGELHRSKSLVGSSFGLYSKGETLEIVYDKENPKKAIPNKKLFLHFYLFPIIAGVISIVTYYFKQ